MGPYLWHLYNEAMYANETILIKHLEDGLDMVNAELLENIYYHCEKNTVMWSNTWRGPQLPGNEQSGKLKKPFSWGLIGRWSGHKKLQKAHSPGIEPDSYRYKCPWYV